MKQIAAPSSVVTSGQIGAGAVARLRPEQALFQPELFRSFKLHRKLAIFISLVGITLSLLYFFRLWPIYEAQSLIYIQPASPRVLEQGGPARWPYDGGSYESYLNQQMTNVTRADVLTGALHKLDRGSWQSSNESDQAEAERLGHLVQVQRAGSYQFAILARAAKPELAAQLANAVTAAYLENANRESRVGDSQRLAILREEGERVQNELNADRTEQSGLGRQLGVAATGTTAPDVLDDEIQRTRGELVSARTAHDEAEARFTSMGSGSASAATDAQADEIAASDPGLSSMKTSLNQRRAALISQMANLTPNHPQYKQDATELDKINTTLDSAMHDLRSKASDRIQQKLHSELQRTASVEDQLNGQLRQLVGAAGGASSKMQRANDLSANITRLEARYSAVDEQIHNLMLEAGGPGAVFLTAAAQPPLHSAKSGVIRNTAVLIFASLFFGLFGAVVAHKLDPRVYIASDVENLIGFAPMAQLPNFSEVSDEIASEHLFRLAGTIEHNAVQGGLRKVVVTGASEGVGVSTLVSRLYPMLHPAGAEEQAPGSNGFVPGASGPLGPSGVQIAETAPLAVSAEAEYMARRSDCTIAVIESGVTTRAQLLATAEALKRLNVGAVGFVLNRIGLSTADPAFRRSISDAERHLRTRGGFSAIKALRERQIAEMASATAEQLPSPAPAPSYADFPSPRIGASTAPSFAAPASAPMAAPDSSNGGPWWLADAAPVPASVPVERHSAPHFKQPAAGFPVSDFQPVETRASDPFSEQSPSHFSRLNGLRGVLFDHGLKNLNRPHAAETGEVPQAAPPLESLYAPPSVGPSYAEQRRESAPPVQEPSVAYAAASSGDLPTEISFTPSSREVMAEPEFLPPREFIPIRNEDSEQDNEGNARRDRRDPYDPVDILPSWRGQYKKKS